MALELLWGDDLIGMFDESVGQLVSFASARREVDDVGVTGKLGGDAPVAARPCLSASMTIVIWRPARSCARAGCQAWSPGPAGGEGSGAAGA